MLRVDGRKVLEEVAVLGVLFSCDFVLNYCERVLAGSGKSFCVGHVVVGGEAFALIVCEELGSVVYCSLVVAEFGLVEEYETLRLEVGRILSEDLVGYTERFGIVLTPVEENGVARFVFGEVVGVLDILAVEFRCLFQWSALKYFSASSR